MPHPAFAERVDVPRRLVQAIFHSLPAALPTAILHGLPRAGMGLVEATPCPYATPVVTYNRKYHSPLFKGE